MLLENRQIKNLEEKICVICNKKFNLKDLENGNFLYTITKRETMLYAHKSCLK